VKDRRYKAVTPVTDFNVSQRIRVQLIEDGHTDLAVESITAPIRDLEEDLGLLQMRVKALELEKVNWQTESGVFRAIKAARKKTTGNWAKKAWMIVGGLALTAAGAVLNRLIEKPH
jgi:hypothetical protein